MSEPSSTGNIKITIKQMRGPTLEVEVENSATIGDIKATIAEKHSIPVEEQRLIYAGQVLDNDEKTLEELKVKTGNTMHMVRKKRANTNNAGSSSTSFNIPQNFAQAQTNNRSVMGIPASQLQAMMNNPMMQQFLNNPEVLREMILNNPQIQQVMERNPEMRHVLNDPNTLRQIAQMATNPALMQEAIRNNDRALANISAHPSGMDALRRIYNDVQRPLYDAVDESSNEDTSNATMNAEDVDPNANPLPNPWAPQGSNPAQANAATPNAAPNMAGMGNMFGNMGGMPNMGGMGMGGMGMGGMGGGMGGGMNPQMLQQMMGNPFVQQMLQNVLANPQMFDQMINTNPMLQQMFQANPQLRQMLQNPQIRQMLANPQFLQNVMQMQGAMGGMGGGMGANPMAAMGGFGAQPGNFGTQPGTAAPNTGSSTGTAAPNPMGTGQAQPGTGQPNPMAFFNPAMFGQVPAQAQPQPQIPVDTRPPAERFQAQIAQLNGMGFTNNEACIQALLQTNGSVQLAIERLLNSAGFN